MKHATGDMFQHLQTATGYPWVATPTCNVLDAKGRLVMGVGHARVVRDRFPGVAETFGTALAPHTQRPNTVSPYGTPHQYGVLVDAERRVIAVQTKFHYRFPSPGSLVTFSLVCLKRLLSEHPALKYAKVHLPLVGTGLGGLTRETVLGIFDSLNLPDSVTLWQLPESS